jgi:predicted nucleic acid-binding protein
MAALLDTGILLRVWDRNDPHHSEIVASVRLMYEEGVDLVTSAQTIAEFWNVSTRPPSARGGYGRSVDETERRVQFLNGSVACFPIIRRRIRSGDD